VIPLGANQNNRVRALLGARRKKSASPLSAREIFGRNHARVYRELEGAELPALWMPIPCAPLQIAKEFSTEIFPDIESLAGRVDAASVAVPTVEHARVGCRLLELGIDVIVEKPMAASLAEADQLLSAAARANRILQVGHLERFNPGIVAVIPAMNHPLYV